MITGQIIQTSIDELKAITKVDLGVYDLNGSEVASTMERDDITTDLITGFAASPADSQVIGVHHLLKIRDEGELLYVLVARGMTDDVYMVGKIAVSQIQNLVIAYKERFPESVTGQFVVGRYLQQSEEASCGSQLPQSGVSDRDEG